MSSIATAERSFGRLLPPWWLFLVTGIGWMLVGLIILRFDYTSVSAISILFGFVAIGAGVIEIGMTMLAQGWWKLLYGGLALIFIVTGIVSFIHPGDTFLALAAVISFFLVLAGTFDIIVAISTRREISAWWLQLVSGIIELALGSGRPATTGAAPSPRGLGSGVRVIHGVKDIVVAFRVREVQHGAAAQTLGCSRGCFRSFLESRSLTCWKPKAHNINATPSRTFQIVRMESCVIENAATSLVGA